jgi:antitoxin ParD1/3/4
MSTIRKSITFTDTLNNWVQSLIAAGEYTNESEYIRDLVRRDRERNSEIMLLRKELQKGLDSGISNKTVDDIFEEAIQELKKNGRV